MDSSSLQDKNQPPAFEYSGQVSSPLINGEAKLSISEKGLSITALFEAALLPYATINALSLADYLITVETDSGVYQFSRLGNWAQPFYDDLLAAYNQAVLQALFIEGDALFSTRGAYQYRENGETFQGAAPVLIYENCVCVLPPTLQARRIPLCFAGGIEKGDYQLSLSLTPELHYLFSRLGHDSDSFAIAMEKQLRALHSRTLAAVTELDPSLSITAATSIARLMPEGAAAPLGKLGEIAPSFISALENKIAASRAAESYSTLQLLCDPTQIYIGFKKQNSAAGKDADDGNIVVMLGSISEDPAITDETAVPDDPYLLWLIAPSPDGTSCVVEFAGAADDAAATFVYQCPHGFAAFGRQLNYALEAINFKREVIRLTDEELQKKEYSHYQMAIKRNQALQFVRSCFAGRLIHSSQQAWRRKLEEIWNNNEASPVLAEEISNNSICPACGVSSPQSTKFCDNCGAKL